MVILLNNETLKPPLPDMPVGTVELMISSHMACHQPLHPSAKVPCPNGPHDHVKMVGHEAVRKNFDREKAPAQSQQTGESFIILTVVEYVLLPVATVEDVVDKSIDKGSRYSWHILG